MIYVNIIYIWYYKLEDKKETISLSIKYYIGIIFKHFIWHYLFNNYKLLHQ